MTRKIVVLGTGGTIAGRAASATDDIGYVAGEVPVSELLGGVAAPARFDVVAEQVAQLDSKDMSFEVWRALHGRCAHWLAQDEVAGIVVTHGTDTLEETAYFLHRTLDARKPVVLTGAMRPATSAQADGPRNLADALLVAGSGAAGASFPGVAVAFAGALHGAPEVFKAHSSRVDAFSSGAAGPLALIQDGAVRPLREPQRGVANKVPTQWPRVEIVMNHAGANGAIVDALVQQGVDGLVVAGTGNGSLNRALEAALLRAREAGVEVLRSSRCPEGGVIDAPRDRLPHAGPLSPVKARIDLLLRTPG